MTEPEIRSMIWHFCGASLMSERFARKNVEGLTAEKGQGYSMLHVRAFRTMLLGRYRESLLNFTATLQKIEANVSLTVSA